MVRIILDNTMPPFNDGKSLNKYIKNDLCKLTKPLPNDPIRLPNAYGKSSNSHPCQ